MTLPDTSSMNRSSPLSSTNGTHPPRATRDPAAADAELILKRSLVRAFLDHVPDAVYFKDKESRFLAVSQSKADRHGLKDPGEMIGKCDHDYFTEAHSNIARREEEEIMRTGEPMIALLNKLTWADGRQGWGMTHKMPLRDAHGTIIGTFGITKDVTEIKQTEIALEQTRKELVDTSRMAGMAEVATGVLHNVGNVLNSLNISATLLQNGLRMSKAESLGRLAGLLQEHAGDLGNFLTNDPKGRRVPELLEVLARQATEERDRLLQEVELLKKNTDHIREIVVMQQAYATMAGIVEPLDAATLMEDSLRMNAGALVRHAVHVARNFQTVPPVLAEKGKVLQILVNLIRNAKYAADDGGALDKTITLRIEPSLPGRVRLIVQDNGIGIPPENLTRIFQHGFTTRATGHGFGLHSSANAAHEMRGSLTAQSDGHLRGATFTLDLPAAIETALPASAENATFSPR